MFYLIKKLIKSQSFRNCLDIFLQKFLRGASYCRVLICKLVEFSFYLGKEEI
jgi:hypothetical protein